MSPDPSRPARRGGIKADGAPSTDPAPTAATHTLCPSCDVSFSYSFPRPLLRLPYVFSSVSPNSPLHNHPHPNLALALPLTPISHPPPAPTSPSDRVVARYRDRRARTRSDVGCRGEPAQADVRGMGQPPRSVGESAGGTSKERERERGGDESRPSEPASLCAYETVRLRTCARVGAHECERHPVTPQGSQSTCLTQAMLCQSLLRLFRSLSCSPPRCAR